MRASRRTGLALLLIVAAAMAWLTLALPADAFFTGDSGLKLIAARNAIAHPSHPSDIDLPLVNGQPVPYVDPMMAVHGDHAHALQSPVFPVLSAPLIALFGLRGAYILPRISFLALLPLLAGATVAALQAAHDEAHASRWALLSGLLGASATLLRPEAAWYGAGVAAIIGVRRWPSFGAGVAAIILPFAVANGIHSGNPLGPHASANLALHSEWLSDRFAFVREWLWPGDHGARGRRADGRAGGTSRTAARAFLLIASPARLVLAAEGASVAFAGTHMHTAPAALVAITLLAGIATTRVAYRELRDTKDAYQRVVSATRANSNAGNILTSDTWRYDQVVAALYGTRVFLYVPDRSPSTGWLNQPRRSYF